MIGARPTIQPPAPLHRFFAIGGRAIRFGWLPTMWARVAGSTRLLRVEAQTNEVTLVAEQPPNLPLYGRVITIIAPAPTHSFAPSSRFERFQGLHGKKGTAMDVSQQQQDIAG
jgi:hypothetical protein